MSDPANPTKAAEGVDFAWRVHAALDSWTGKVDTKASIALAIESAIVGFVITLSKKGERFADLEGWSHRLYDAGVAALLFAVLLALLVVMPHLKRRKSRQIWRSNMIYFGHLRHWDPSNLAAELRNLRTSEAQLARQLVTMSQIAWRKHARLQWSLTSLLFGGACLVGAALTS